jgi:predicted AAA+ superfamily ATPase
MPISDLDVHRAAHQWTATHGDRAAAMARQMVETMR